MSLDDERDERILDKASCVEEAVRVLKRKQASTRTRTSAIANSEPSWNVSSRPQ